MLKKKEEGERERIVCAVHFVLLLLLPLLRADETRVATAPAVQMRVCVDCGLWWWMVT